jgi:hypothetical protein
MKNTVFARFQRLVLKNCRRIAVDLGTFLQQRKLAEKSLTSYHNSKAQVVQGREQNGKFHKTSTTSKGATLQYLVCTAWGLGDAYISRLKKNSMAEEMDLLALYCRRRQTPRTNSV